MSYSRLCIASDIPANKEGLDGNGIWVKAEDTDDLTDKLCYTSENYDKVAPLERQNFERVKDNFTWAKISAQYVGYLKSI